MLPQTAAQQQLLAQRLSAAQPRPNIFESILRRDPSVQYGTVPPLGVQTAPDPAGSLLAEQRTVLAMPELVRGLIEGITAVDRVRRGKLDPMTGAMLAAGVAPVGGLLARAPAGALGMNVFHGTPHRFAPEPDFPQGRPRLDKMGTGEGAQMYGPGFYSAEAPKTAKKYADEVKDMNAIRDINEELARLANIMSKDEVGGQYRKYKTDAGRQAAQRYDELLDGRTAVIKRPGNLYKLDIPDADAAKLLDYDAPISQQPQVVQDAITKLGFMPDNPDKVAGGDIWFRMRQQLGENEEAAAMRDAGVPGLRYKDAGSRGTDSAGGTRNLVVWDQDVLDRTKVLQRNDEVFENKMAPQQMRDLLADPFGA